MKEQDTQDGTQGEGALLELRDYGFDDDWSSIYTTDGEAVAYLSLGMHKANARRIVATWNACDGIPTEALDAGVIGDMVEALRAMTKNHEFVCSVGRVDPNRNAAYRAARATLAKLEGKP